MPMVQLANGNMFDSDNLPRRFNPATGQMEAYDPTDPAAVANAPNQSPQALAAPRQAVNSNTIGMAGAAFNNNNATAPAALIAALASNQPGSSANTLAQTLQSSAPQPRPTTPPGQITLRAPNGSWVSTGNVGEINDYLKQGYQATRANGDVQQTKPLGNGYVIDYGGGQFLPLDTVLNGRMTESQKQAMVAAGYTNFDGVEIIPDKAASAGSNTTSTTPSAGASSPGSQLSGGAASGNTPLQLGGDLSDMLKQLMQQSLNQGTASQNALKPLLDALQGSFQSNQGNSDADRASRNDLVKTLLGQVTPGIASAIGTMNDATGLSPEAMATLRQQALEGPQRDYQGQVEQLKTSLAGRGAYGGGDTPGSLGDIVRGYAPLMTSRDQSRENLLAQTTLADEQRKFDTLSLNRQSAANAMGIGAGLTGSVGNLYQSGSNASLNANQSALQTALAALNGQTTAGFQGINGATGAANSLNDASTGSLSSILKSSLLSTGLAAGRSALDQVDWGKLGTSIWNTINGGGSGVTLDTTDFPNGARTNYDNFTTAWNRLFE